MDEVEKETMIWVESNSTYQVPFQGDPLHPGQGLTLSLLSGLGEGPFVEEFHEGQAGKPSS